MGADCPDVSVLMGVYNTADTLDRTLDSVLGQQGVTLEFIVVDDGSTDATGDILDRRAAIDPRLVVVHQPNAGLTAALVRGSERVRGRYIARQDGGGDRSLPDRLARQRAALEAAPGSVFCTCGHSIVDAAGIFLCEDLRVQEDIDRGLTTLAFPGIRGILHPSVMMRTDAFRDAGGYREAFRVAQDIDLWLRLLERGSCVAVQDILYEYRFDDQGISATRHGLQMGFADLAVRCALARRSGEGEPLLQPSDAIVSAYTRSPTMQAAEYDYFLASCLRKRDPSRARAHYLRAWRRRPADWKALVGAMLTW